MALRLTPGQFEFMADRMGAHGISRKCCRRVLVDGERPCDVARALDINPTLISVSLRYYRKFYDGIAKHFLSVL
jgi:hypothetical protein